MYDDIFAYCSDWKTIFESPIENIPGSRLGIPFLRAQQDSITFIINEKEIILSQSSLGVVAISGVVWDAGLLMADFLMHWSKKQDLQDLKILDLGCGTGIVGITCLELGAKNVTFTDRIKTDSFEDNIEQYQKNCSELGRKLEFFEYDWNEPLPSDFPLVWDVIVSSDIMYDEKCLLPLLHLLPSLTFSLMIIAYKRRHDDAERQFLDTLNHHGYEVVSYPLSLFPSINLKGKNLSGLYVLLLRPTKP